MPFIGEQEIASPGIQDLHSGIASSSGNVFPIGGPGQRIYGIGKRVIIDQVCYSCPCVPDSYLIIASSRSDIHAIRRPGQCVDKFVVPDIGQQMLAGEGVPDLHGVIPASRSDVPAIWGPGESAYFSVVSSIGPQMLTGEGVPDLYGVIPASRSDILSVQRRGQRVHDLAM